jgi:hypothetical protein
VDALQDYGHYMQQSGWTDGKTHTAVAAVNALDADDISAAQTGVSGKAIVKDLGTSDVEDIMFALTLNEKTVINVFGLPAEGKTIDSAAGAWANGTQVIGGKTYYRYDTDKIGPRKLGNNYTVTLRTEAGNATVQVSAMSYVYSVLNSGTFTEAKQLAMTAYYNYFAAAAAYN